MARFRLRIKRSARKELESIGKKADRRRIIQRIQSLADDPRPLGAQKLSGREWYRIRQGRYRVLYSIEDELLVVQIIRTGDRTEVY